MFLAYALSRFITLTYESECMKYHIFELRLRDLKQDEGKELKLEKKIAESGESKQIQTERTK